MIKKVSFVKMQGAGNDFVLVDARSSARVPVARAAFAKKICDRKFGVGADGLLVLQKTRNADVRMRIFNADGSEAQMCGNGARCLALYYSQRSHKKAFRIETGSGVLEARVTGRVFVRLHMTDPTDIRLDQRVRLGQESVDVDYINSGVPHAVVEVKDLESVPVLRLGRALRRHDLFAPAGTNVNFIRIIDAQRIDIRTYERGVEAETLACGTGSVAGAIISALNHTREGLEETSRRGMRHKIRVRTRSGETLTVSFVVSKYAVSDVWLEGKAQVIHQGVYYV